jgi:hypothetical protein
MSVRNVSLEDARYYDAKSWWGRQGNEFRDLRGITAFSVLVKDDPLSKPENTERRNDGARLPL